jgi:hypothetical protein
VSLQQYKSLLKRARIVLAPGLSSKEIAVVESRFGMQFPPDYRALLMDALPISGDFVDWRHGDPIAIQRQFAWPYEGICFDIEHSDFWLPEWGPRPTSLTDAFAIAAQAVQQAPVLIPICGHRYIPATPSESGNPIFSVYQTDIIYYGRDLLEYLENELSRAVYGEQRYQISEPVKVIPFWSYLVDLNNGQIVDGSV